MTRGRAALALVLVLLLAGCTAIPTAGPVQVGRTQKLNDPNAQFVPSRPLTGASPKDIVQGFVYAQIAGGAYRVAKQFLTRDFARRWDPRARVFVQEPSPLTLVGDGDEVSLSVPTSAVVDEVGAYTPSRQTRTVPFELAKEGGQWRISDCPDGIIVPESEFAGVFGSESLQYFDDRYTRLVPDLRWFPTDSDTDTALRALFRPLPPQSPIRDVVRSAFPNGTRLAAPVVSGPSGTTVSITVPGATPGVEQTARMQQQIAGSLTKPVAQIALVVNGETAPPARPLPSNSLSSNPFVLAGGRFGPISARGVAEQPVLGRRIAATNPTAVTVSERQRLAAVLTKQGVQVVDPGTTRIVDDRAGLVEPTLDQQGWTYSVPGDDPSGLRATPAKGRSVSLPSLGGVRVIAIEVSFDGTRLLVLIDTSGGPVAYVTAIERRADGTPTGLGTDRYPVDFDADGALDATWVNDGSVAVLTSGGDQQTVVDQELGGLPRSLGRPVGAVSLVGTSTPNDVRMLIGGSGDLNELSNGFQQPVFSSPVKVAVLAVQR